MLREVPFAALYFTLYSRIKASMLGDRDTLGFLETLGAATVSALPVSFITTPADVIKTRMQAAAGSGVRRAYAVAQIHVMMTGANVDCIDVQQDRSGGRLQGVLCRCQAESHAEGSTAGSSTVCC